MEIREEKTFLAELDEVIQETGKYLAERTAGRRGPCSVRQLQSLQEYLKAISANVRNRTVPPQAERQKASKGWIVVDSWDPKDPLGGRILNVNSYYLSRIP